MHRTHGSTSNFGGNYRSLTPHGSVNDITLPEEMRGSLFCDPSNNTTSIPIFTHDGGINADVEGVSQLQFQKLTWFYSLLSISWPRMVLLSGALYISVVLAFAVVYYSMCMACGAHTTIIGALYFVVVSISANGGYMGEDTDVLYPGHRCFAQRTYLVMVASYAGILIGALIATTFIAKISMHNKLQHRIVFSDYVTLTQTEMESYVLSFRVANISASPMVHGRLRLYLVSSKPGPEQRAALNSGVFVPKHESSKTKRRKSLLGVVGAAPKASLERRATVNPTSSRTAPVEISLPIPDDTADATALDRHEKSKLLGAMRAAASGIKSPALSYGSSSPTSTLPGGTNTGGGGGSAGERATNFPVDATCDDTDSADGGLRVTPMFMCVEELPWCCDEEMPLPGSEGNLNLWFPGTIRHVVDRDSPVYYAMMGLPRPSTGGMYHRGHRHFFHQNVNPRSPSTASPLRPFRNTFKSAAAEVPHGGGTGFQIAVVFEATDAATSSIIESKHVYTPDMLIADHHFAFPTIVSQQQKTSEYTPSGSGGGGAQNIDFYCFNELEADDADLDDDE
jgi:hypothetical protein